MYRITCATCKHISSTLVTIYLVLKITPIKCFLFSCTHSCSLCWKLEIPHCIISWDIATITWRIAALTSFSVRGLLTGFIVSGFLVWAIPKENSRRKKDQAIEQTVSPRYEKVWPGKFFNNLHGISCRIGSCSIVLQPHVMCINVTPVQFWHKEVMQLTHIVIRIHCYCLFLLFEEKYRPIALKLDTTLHTVTCSQCWTDAYEVVVDSFPTTSGSFVL